MPNCLREPVGKIDEAEAYLLKRADQLNGDFYGSLLSLAEAMESENRNLAAGLIYRSLLISIPERGYTKAYPHGIRYLKKLDKLAATVSDWKNFNHHEAFKGRIWQDHGRRLRMTMTGASVQCDLGRHGSWLGSIASAGRQKPDQQDPAEGAADGHQGGGYSFVKLAGTHVEIDVDRYIFRSARNAAAHHQGGAEFAETSEPGEDQAREDGGKGDLKGGVKKGLRRPGP